MVDFDKLIKEWKAEKVVSIDEFMYAECKNTFCKRCGSNRLLLRKIPNTYDYITFYACRNCTSRITDYKCKDEE